MNHDLPNTVDGRTFAIGVLAVTACVLFVGFMLTAMQPAQATGQIDRGGDYKMLTQQISRSREALIVVDSAAKRAVIYDFDYGNKQLQIAATIPLDELPKGRDTGSTPPAPETTRRRQ